VTILCLKMDLIRENDLSCHIDCSFATAVAIELK